VLITYQRNMRSSLSQQHVLHDVFPDLVVHPQEEADDRAGDQDDRGAADDGLLVGPLDLAELGERLLDEDPRTEAVPLGLLAPRAPLAPALGLGAAARGRPCRAAGRRAPCEGRFLLRAPGAPLLARLPCHRGAASASPDAGCGGRTSGSTS